MSFMAFMFLELVASVEKMNGFQFRFHGGLFRIRHILERRPVFTQVEPDQFHDPFSAHDITAVMADYVDDFL